MAQTRHPSFLHGLSSVADRYDLLLCDIWGVIHNGVAAFPAACDALSRFRDAGGKVVLLSNAPRPAHAVVGALDKLGVPRDAYDGIVTSGDVTREIIAQRAGLRVFHIGPERDLPVFEGLDAPLVGPREADYAVCTGLADDDREGPQDYAQVLRVLRDRRLPMLCANPDIVVDRGGRMIFCAGAIAAAYDELGGEVLQAGKPHLAIYHATMDFVRERWGEIARERVIAVGDSIRTDIAGANAFGIDSLFVARGIHAGDAIAGQAFVEADLHGWLARQAEPPVYAADHLSW